MDKVIEVSIENLISESDVEQKFILPLLVSDSNIGLGYGNADFITKPSIKSLKIDKGASQKQYYPDYVIVYGGLPLFVIEAKKPGEDLMEAYREAMLYCLELNSEYPANVNPCHKILVSNGLESICGYADSKDSLKKVGFEQVNNVDINFEAFRSFLCKETVFDYGKSIHKKIRGNAFFVRPLSLLGGKAIQNEQLKENSFGSTLSLEFRYLFNPESSLERKTVVNNAYVRTKRHLKHVDPIDRIIKATLPLGLASIQQIADTSLPKEVIQTLQKKQVLKNQLLLLIGSVGSGKTTFTDYLKEVAIGDQIRKDTVWLSLNMNKAPLNKVDIYTWLKAQILHDLKETHNDIDWDEFANLKKVYSVEVNAFHKNYAPLLGEDSTEFKVKMADRLMELQSNLDATSKAFTRYLCSERGKLLVIVLDNSDKRKAEDQLLMFDVATWLKEEFNCLVFLPIRDTTYSLYRKEPPLDTVINDFIFRIDPPLLKEVIIERIKYALREMDKGNKRLTFNLSDDIKVEYPSSDQGYYLASIAKSLFENTYFSRLITGLAGRDIREGLRIFLNFCKSGHLDASEIFKIRKEKGNYILPNHLISRTILRGSYKYYSSENSYVKNIFECFYQDDIPDPFVRLGILRWLDANFTKTGPTRNIGYHKIAKVILDLNIDGHSQDRLIKEMEFLINQKYLITESQSEENFELEDLVSISASGKILLELMNDPNYLSACAEDVYYRENQVASGIADRCSEKNGISLYSKESMLNNAQDLIVYLEKYKHTNLIRRADTFSKNVLVGADLLSLEKQRHIVEKFIEKSGVQDLSAYQDGSIIEGQVSGVKEYGIFVEFGLSSKGFVHISELEKHDFDINDIEKGDSIQATIQKYDSIHHRFKLVSPLRIE